MFDLVLIDGNNRARAAASHLDTGPVKTFFGDIKKVLSVTESKVPVILWDHPDASNVRREIYKDYKKDREFDENAAVAVAQCLKAAIERKMPCWWDAGYEGDDLIASLIAGYPDKRILIYSSDRDLFQHLSDRVSQLNLSPYNEKHEIMTPAKVYDKYGIRPDQWVDYYAIKGDNNDNIPGVRNIGEVNAKQLIQKHGSIAGILTDLPNVRLQKRMLDSLNQAFADGHLSTMVRLVAPRIFSPLPETLVAEIANWTE